MQSKTITVQSPQGIHLRVAAKVVEVSRQHQSKVTFYKDGKKASAESILELLFLEATHKSQVTMVADGRDESGALEHIGLVLMDGAGI